ncbi:hypothetical protein [Brevundimonas sp.]|uniref:hypothetical protein n=1 Tax=Brevundimonas sp. TaxID=1871086 RepID=UPI002D49D355|nr:hypothetical protein [Brevundimonas sp.]HYD26959.1 hypothetical protein [Brevundimonas sp.]
MTMFTPRVTAGFTRAASATAYAALDLVANSTTAADVAPLVFAKAARRAQSSGTISGASVVLEAASGSVAMPSALELLLFRAAPFADGAYPADNAPLVGASGALTEAALKNLVGRFQFTSFLQGGAAVAQAAGQPIDRAITPFSLYGAGETARDLYGLLYLPTGASWTPGNVAYDFSLALDVYQD